MVPNVVSLVGSLHRQRVFERDEAIVDATREKLNTCNTLIAFESLRQSFYTPEHHPFINNEIKTISLIVRRCIISFPYRNDILVSLKFNYLS